MLDRPAPNDSKQATETDKPSVAQAPAITLPKGGGAIAGMGEKFAANPVTGTASLSVPILTSPSRNDFYPKLSLSYDSGAGNGPFGFGWMLSLPSVTRKTEKEGLPRYWDAQESDVFILSEAEDLVPVLKPDGSRAFHETSDGRYQIYSYRPRIEGLFSRIEKWQSQTDVTDTFWKSVSKDNITSFYGRSPNSRIADPKDNSRSFKWLLEESYDDRGNRIVYEYKTENEDGIDRSLPQEKNRLSDRASYTNRYLKFVNYGNRTPSGSDWCFQVVFDYSQPDPQNPQLYDLGDSQVNQSPQWICRPDAFSSFRSGFEIRTYRLCNRVLMFHHFPELGDEPYLVHSTDFDYSDPQDPKSLSATYLVCVTQTGYVKDIATGDYQKKSLPKLEFDYTKPEVKDRTYTVDAASLENLPIGLDGNRYQWVDLDSEGISGILTQQAGAWFYKRNLSNARLTLLGDRQSPPVALPLTEEESETVEFAPVEVIATQPSTSNLQGTQQQLMDLAGDGTKYLVQFSRPLPGFYERSQTGEWENFVPFLFSPNVNWNDPNLKFIDLNGDGFADILISEDWVFTWYPSLARQGFGSPQQVHKVWDEEHGPTTLVFADPTQSIYLADMDGDGLTDIVRIRNGEVCYWSNMGYGRFGSKVTMANAPWFDYTDQFDQKRIRLGDIDGSGTTDIIYLGHNRISLYFNQSGNSWSEPRYLTNIPAIDDLSAVTVVDLLGNGTACIVWSSPLAKDARQPMRYIDLMGGQKPHLMVSVKNNMGMERSLEYTASTRFYLEARLAGTPWVTKLPFPVHVLTRVETKDTVTQTQLVSLYRYHHGYYDGFEREFRGFGLVEQWDTEYFPDSNTPFQVPPVYTKTWFHTGAYLDRQNISQHFEHEYYREPGETDQAFAASLLPDTILPTGLVAQEEREACRSLKGRILRQEIYALDGSDKQPHPYSVSERNYEIRLEQALQTNRHAVFFAHDRETIDYHYERNPSDPRVTHAMTLEVDEFGNGLKSVALTYPRRQPAYPEQAKTLITYTENQVTNKPNDKPGEPDWYRIGVPIETRTYEITGLPAAILYSLDFIRTQLPTAVEIPYEVVPTPNTLQKRLIERVRMLYRKDSEANTTDPTPLPLGQIDSLALSSESFKLAFTPGLLAQVYNSKIGLGDLNALLSNEGRYVQQDGDWWIPSGRQAFDPAQFYLAIATKDPFGQTFTTTYDAYKLLPIKSEDPVGNVVQVNNDYRVMQPQEITDPNGNRSQVAFDALGMVVGTAIMGKATGSTEGDSFTNFQADLTPDEIKAFFEANDPRSLAIDHLGTATTRIIYDLERVPVCAAALARKIHVSDLAGQPLTLNDVQVSFVYSDGFGREAQTKAQAEPGSLDLSNPNSPTVNPRWVGTGTKVYNNKGKPVRQYEPFFSANPKFGIEQQGVSSTLFYDPLERVMATLHPNHTYEKVVFDPWKQETWDVNDTVLQEDPKNDPDVEGFFKGLPDADYLPAWYTQRKNGQLGTSEQQAATKAAAHANTPAIAHLDVLGRTFLTVADNGTDLNGSPQKYETRVELDIEGNQRSITDALKRQVMTYDYDLLSHQIHQSSVDAGERWMLNSVAGHPIRMWDSRGYEIRHFYDALQRPTELWVQSKNQSKFLAEQIVYGESHPNAGALNLRGKVFQQYDGAGVVTNRGRNPATNRDEAYDFKGNLLRSNRQLLQNYKDSVDWAASLTLENETFSHSTRYDALNRPVTLTTPDGSITHPIYNEANLLEQVKVNLRGSNTETVFVTNFDYNAKGQRVLVEYGNGVKTEYTYDPETFRLIRLHTTRTGTPNSSPLLLVDSNQLQDLHYTYDPVGNITKIRDDALPTIIYDGERVESICRYTYDALYRLTHAEGREHAGQNNYQPTATRDTYRDYPFLNLPNANDLQAFRNYSEDYDYDPVGNIQRMAHQAKDGGWTRRYAYDSQSNRLQSTSLPGDPDAGPFSGKYGYDEHGNMIQMPHLAQMDWDFKDQLQRVNLGGGGTAYYVYDASGQRVRKVIERQNGTRQEERIYLGGYEVFRQFSGDGSSTTLERETLHIMDDKRRIALVETKTQDGGTSVASATPIIRYQLDNHLGSTVLELDNTGNILSYEEYHPYGTTSFQARSGVAEVSLKRYRYTGKERDEESGLYYHGARYYAAWLGRWTSCDPAGMVDNSNLYLFVRGNPVRYTDRLGLQSNEYEDLVKELSQVAKEVDKAGLGIGETKPSGSKLEELPKPQNRRQTTPVDERYEADKAAAKSRRLANSLKRNPSGVGKPQPGDEMAHMSAARHNKISTIPNDIANDPKNIKSMPATGKNARVTNPNGSSRDTDFHAAHESMLDEIQVRNQAGKTPGTLASSIAAQNAMEEAKIKSEYMTREHLDRVKAGKLASPEKGAPVDPQTGRVINAESPTASASEGTRFSANPTEGLLEGGLFSLFVVQAAVQLASAKTTQERLGIVENTSFWVVAAQILGTTSSSLLSIATLESDNPRFSEYLRHQERKAEESGAWTCKTYLGFIEICR